MKSLLSLVCFSLFLISQTTSNTLCEETLPAPWKACDYTAASHSQKTLQLYKNTPIALQARSNKRLIGGDYANLYQPAKKATYNKLLEHKEGLFYHYLPEKDFVGKDTAIIYFEQYHNNIAGGIRPEQNGRITPPMFLKLWNKKHLL
ncbi:MAG: hypothetical protein ACPGVF_05040 [Flavobacteriaceae bacterium]